MPPAERLGAFALASLILIVVPGPSVLFVIGRSLAYGRRGGLLSVVGNALGVLPLVAAVALGLGAVVAASATLFTAIKLAGAAYLVYLGIQAIRHRGLARAQMRGAGHTDLSSATLLRQGFVVGVSNPKTIVFLVAVLPQFVSVASGVVPMQMMVLGAVFVVLALASDAIWALAAGSAQEWFARSPRRIAGLRATGGAMMVGLGATLALTGNRT
jgi:threonine/homoserine/homoserine lactone efflux protein